MTKISVIKNFAGGLANKLKKILFVLGVEFKNPKLDYPLYWLAPAIDRGAKYVKIRSMYKEAPRYEAKSNLFHLPGTYGILKFVLSVMGLGPREGKKPRIKVARIEGGYMVERGQHWVRLAALINPDYVYARVVEYDFISFKKRMHVLQQPNGAIVGVTGGQKGRIDYYGIYPAQLDVLVRCHRVPSEDRSVVALQEPAVGMGRVPAPGGQATKSRSNLVLLKK